MSRTLTTEQFNLTLKAITPRLTAVLHKTGDVTEYDVFRACQAENATRYRHAAQVGRKARYVFGAQRVNGEIRPATMKSLARFADAFLAA